MQLVIVKAQLGCTPHTSTQILGIVYYATCSYISSSFVLNFVITTVLLALDFWTVGAPHNPHGCNWQVV